MKEKFDHGLQCIRTESEKYIRVIGGKDEYYELGKDRDEENNLLDELDELSGEVPEQANALKSKIENDLDDEAASKIVSEEAGDEAIKQNLRDLGYL